MHSRRGGHSSWKRSGSKGNIETVGEGRSSYVLAPRGLPSPCTVIITDAGVTRPKRKDVGDALRKYISKGGVAVCMGSSALLVCRT